MHTTHDKSYVHNISTRHINTTYLQKNPAKEVYILTKEPCKRALQKSPANEQIPIMTLYTEV